MQDMKMRDQLAGLENEGKVSMENQFVKKCLKAVVLMYRIIPVLHVYHHHHHHHHHLFESGDMAHKKRNK